MTAKEIYQRKTGDIEPSNQITYHEWYNRYVKWMQHQIEKLLK